MRSGRTAGAFDPIWADGQTLVAWDVDFVDARRFPLPDGIRVLVVRFKPTLAVTALCERVAELLAAFEAEKVPHRVVVLEPTREAVPKRVGQVRKKAA
ncbi:MAG TPA: hypothetical protein VEJ18_06740 [Planctomycetota bacterium]|nr:hypothetical protein [Planctomycetota bacterium]